MGGSAKDDDTAVTYPLLGNRSMSSMLDEYDARTDEELGIRQPPDCGSHNVDDSNNEDSGIYISLDDYRYENWRSCRANFRRSTGDLLSDEVDPKIEMHMTLPNTPTRASMPPFSVYFGTSEDDIEWRKQGGPSCRTDGHGESRRKEHQARSGVQLSARASHADRILFKPSAHAA